MHKAGGWIALIASLFCFGAALLGTTLTLDEGDRATGVLFGGFTVAGILLILSIIILNTRSRLPPILLLAFIAFLIYFGLPDGLIMICLGFAALGGIFALFS